MERGAESVLSLNLRNASPKPIIAYFLEIRLLDGAKRVETYTNAKIDTVHAGLMPPGGRWTIETGTGGPARPNLAALQREVVVDYVLFADDSQWGPDVNQQSTFVRAVLYGAAGERRRLRSVLESEGVDKLLEDLSREVPRHRVRPGGK